MTNRGSPADLQWVPFHGTPRAEEEATPLVLLPMALLVRWLRQLLI